MIGKIIALVIAMLFLVAAPVYGSIANPASAIDFGAGDGEGEVIADVDSLKAVLESIPALDDYLDNESILDINENFKSFTMVEDGYSMNTSFGAARVDHDDDDSTADVMARTDTTVTRSHVLEICFALEGLYYNIVGEIETLVDYKDYENPSEYIKQDRNVSSYEIEIFYSAEDMLVKYNAYSLKDFTRDDPSDSWEPVEYDEETATEAETIKHKSIAMLDDVYGKWMKVEEPDLGIDLENPDFSAEGMTKEEQYELGMKMAVAEFANQFSDAWIKEITNSTELNCQYLRMLSAFITGNLDTAFNNAGSDYSLKSGEEYAMAYLNGLNISTSGYDTDGSDNVDADCFFNVGSDEVTLTQFAQLEKRREITDNYSGYERNQMYTVTTFKNVNNTKAELKDVTVDTVYNTFYEPVRELLEELYASEEEAN